jgi:FKBP-type peptidyl-prolyl cis-trans isomerase
MVSNDPNNKPEENGLPENDEPDGLSADQVAEVRAYDEVEAWKKSKNTLYSVLGVIALAVAVSSFYNSSKESELAEKNIRFLNATMGGVSAKEQFLSFAEDYDDALGGVAQYRAAAISYDEGNFSEAAEHFLIAATQLQGDPLQGRAKIGHAISLIKSDKREQGIAKLSQASSDSSLLGVDRYEAAYLLGVDALSSKDEAGFEKQRAALSGEDSAASYLARLMEYKRLNTLYEQSKSLPEVNLAKGAEYLSKQRKRKNVKETETGLLYEVLTKGDGAKPTAEDEVEVHYHGTLISGDVFDSSKDRGEPAKFRVGQVIKGWTEALQLMNVGAKWKLFIPSDLAYGNRGSGSIGPNEALTFEVELLGITPPLPEPELPDLNESEPRPAVFPAKKSSAGKKKTGKETSLDTPADSQDKEKNSSK